MAQTQEQRFLISTNSMAKQIIQKFLQSIRPILQFIAQGFKVVSYKLFKLLLSCEIKPNQLLNIWWLMRLT